MAETQPYRIDTEQGLYPIVYVRGFAPTGGSREDTFYDAYYGFAETSVEKRQTMSKGPGGQLRYMEPDIFEGQLIRFIKEEGYIDAANHGLELGVRGQINPTRSLWISRFYDQDYLGGRVREIEDHAEDLRELICERIPRELAAAGQARGRAVDLGADKEDYKVILIAHSMGGLVCRCLIQNILPAKGQDPRRWIHRLVTIATPHKGIDLGAVPDFLEGFISGQLNVLGSAIFQEPRMRKYLKLNKPRELHDLNGTFPPERCLCVIGSDYENYSVAKKVVGSHSDGLVKQDRAYIKDAYWANVHRSHSGHRGIVNSYESYQNIRRFLFGDTRVDLSLEDVQVKTDAPAKGTEEFYDFEFSVSIRGTGVFLHQRKQNPCENAMRYTRREGDRAIRDPKTGRVVTAIPLHIGFLDTKLRRRQDPFSYFTLAFRVAQHRVQKGWLWDNEYPERTIYSETMEARVGNEDENSDQVKVQYRWLSDATDPEGGWQTATLGDKGMFRLSLRDAATFGATLAIKPGEWRPGAPIG